MAFYLLRDEIKWGKNRCGGSIYRSYTNLKMTYYTEKIFLHFLIHSTRCEEPGKELRRKKKSLFLLHKAADFLFYHRAIKNKFITFMRRMKTQILLLELFLRDIYFCILFYLQLIFQWGHIYKYYFFNINFFQKITVFKNIQIIISWFFKSELFFQL